MSSSRSSRSGRKPRASYTTLQQLLESLATHRVNTLTELRRIEQVAAACEDADDARAFQAPMTAAWLHYVHSHQLLSELRGLTPRYPFAGAVLDDAVQRVVGDPLSNRSWNLAWLCLAKIRDDGLLPLHAAAEASQPAMWGCVDGECPGDDRCPHVPTPDEVAQLAQCFEYEWTQAVTTMLRHWPTPPTWY